jgi:hypothetical protein
MADGRIVINNYRWIIDKSPTLATNPERDREVVELSARAEARWKPDQVPPKRHVDSFEHVHLARPSRSKMMIAR